MRQLIFFLFFLFSTLYSSGQNMVLNPSFEQYTQCPSNFGVITNATNWNNGNGASCLYYNSCNSNLNGVPSNFAGYQHAYSGNAYGGIMIETVQPGAGRNYLKGQLTPLQVGGCYKVEIHVCKSEYYSPRAVDGIGVFFFQNGIGVNTSSQLYIPVIPQIDYSPYGIILDTMSWVTLIDTFYADSAYTNLVIGNFNYNVNWVIENNYILGSFAYYYIDEPIVEQITYIPLTANSIVVNACYGTSSGSATVFPIGGLPTFTYLWSNGQTTQTATGLSAGTYTCTITDVVFGTYTQTITITQPTSAIIASVTNATSATCGQQNGSATVSASGGTPGYQYQWLPYGGSNPTANNLGGGTCTVNVADANNCLTSVIVTINQTNAFTLSTIPGNPNCNGGTGSATVTPTGGTQPFSYMWSNGQTTQTATGLTAGTYTVTVSDANGCTNTATVTITQPAILGGTITQTQTINCYGYATAVCVFGPYGGTGPYIYQWSNGQTTSTATGLGAGTHTVTVTDSKGCAYSTSIIITQPPQLNLTTNSVTNASCAQSNGSASVSASGGTPGYVYSWSPYGGSGTTATGLGAGVFTVTVTDGKSCTDTVHVTVNTSTPLNVNVNSVTNINCFGQSTGAASVSVSGGTQPYTYLWNNGAVTAGISGVPAGAYNITVTDANGCAGTASVTITQPPLLNVAVNAITYVNCYGQSTGSANVSVTGGSPIYSYLWQPAGGTNAMASNLAAGSYTVTVTDSKGCTDTAQAVVNQAPLLVVNASSANATCSQNNGWAVANVSGGAQPYSYSWSNGGTNQTINNLAAGSYTVTVTDANGCTANASVTITQSAQLTLNVSASNISCNSLGDGTATVTVSTGTQPYTYSWSNSGTTQTISGLTAGTYTINVTDAINCQGTATVTISEPTALNVSFINSTDVLCNGQQTGIAEAMAGGGTTPYTYLWSNGDTSALQNALGAGSYSVTVTDSNGCQATTSVVITEPTAMTLTAQATANSCAGEAQGAATVTATAGTAPYTYLWNSTPQQSTANAGSLAPGTYMVTVTDNNGCTQTATVIVGAYPSPVVDAGDDKVYCYGKDIVTLHAAGADTYVWLPPTGLSCTACADPEATPAGTTTYTLTGTDTNGCAATDQVTVSVLTKEPASVGMDGDVCSGEGIELSATGGGTYYWSPADGMADNTMPNPTVAPQQTTEYTVIIKQNDCFSDTLRQTVTVHTMPSVSLGADINTTAGASINLHADTLNATSLTWEPPFNLSCTDCVNPVAEIEKDIRYVVTVSNGPCKSVDDISIRLSCDEGDIFLANSFTPNDDGHNDFFYPQSAGFLQVEYMAVYDRWGEKIFERRDFKTNDPASGWNGTYKGKPLDSNVYSYYLQFLCGNGHKVMLKGDVSIVK